MPILNTTTVGRFCREIVCGIDDLPTLLNDWGLSPEEFLELKGGEAFQRELRTAVQDVRDIGPDAPFIVRCKLLSEHFLGEVVGMMESKMTPPEVKAALFKHITSLARLEAPKTPAQAQGQTGPLVTFNFGPGMPGMPEKLVVEAAPAPAQIEQEPADG